MIGHRTNIPVDHELVNEKEWSVDNSGKEPIANGDSLGCGETPVAFLGVDDVPEAVEGDRTQTQLCDNYGRRLAKRHKLA